MTFLSPVSLPRADAKSHATRGFRASLRLLAEGGGPR